jgi:hypothetical protein
MIKSVEDMCDIRKLALYHFEADFVCRGEWNMLTSRMHRKH